MTQKGKEKERDEQEAEVRKYYEDPNKLQEILNRGTYEEPVLCGFCRRSRHINGCVKTETGKDPAGGKCKKFLSSVAESSIADFEEKIKTYLGANGLQ